MGVIWQGSVVSVIELSRCVSEAGEMKEAVLKMGSRCVETDGVRGGTRAASTEI